MTNINTDGPSDEPTQAEQDAYDLQLTLQTFSESFDKLCQERHEVGQAEYGQFTFLGNDVIRMMMEELADTSNYCRMQFIKLMMLQHQLEEELSEKNLEVGFQAFKGTKDVGWRSKG